MGCGHYGIFNGSKWRKEIMPRIRNFARMNDTGCDPIPEEDLKLIADLPAERFNRDTHGVAAIRRWFKEREGKVQEKENVH